MNQCEQWKEHTGDICFGELMELQSCYDSHKSMVRVPSDTNQKEAEATAERLLLGLPLLSPSPECEAAIRPFLCLYLFGSCDSDNNLHQVTQTSCIRLRDDVCAREFILAEGIVGQGVLPNCDDLLQQEEECHQGN